MIKKLTINNFRCFKNTTVVFQDVSILVGRNNAGKSTLIEALKVISTVVRKYRNLSFIRPPEWIPNETDNGVSPSMENQNISDKGIFNMYGSPPAVIEAYFSNGCSIRAYVGERLSLFALLIGKDGIPVRNAREAKQLAFPSVEVLPQISALMENEKVISKSTVVQNKNTRLTSRNFRNQLYYSRDLFPHFKELVESTWEGLQVNPVEITFSDGGQYLQFLVRNHNFTAEIGWMGHGLQMWVQCMWFLSQCQEDAVVILDEPDVYMHADLQRRLIRLVSKMFSQLIIATHSVEIMEEVTANSIIPIDSKRRQIKPIGNHSLLLDITDEMGSAFNLDLSRMFLSKRFMIWEGEDTDRQILSGFQSVISPRDYHPISSFPKIYVEGWGGWQRAIAVADIFNQNRVGIKCYCVFDSDYHLDDDIKNREEDAKRRNINLHIWKRKEIENYVLNPAVIFRFIKERKRKGQVTESLLSLEIQEIIDSLREEYIQDVAEEIRMSNKALSVKSSMVLAKQAIEERWKVAPLYLLSGKAVVKKLSKWSQTNFGVAINALNLSRYFRPEEVPEEVKEVIGAIVNGTKF